MSVLVSHSHELRTSELGTPPPTRPTRTRRRVASASGLLCALAAIGAALPRGAAADTPVYSTQLTRAPYLTDLTATGVQVNWGSTAQNRGTVSYGHPGDCAANTATSTTLGYPMTVNNVKEYRNSVTLTGLDPSGSYCYRISTGGTAPVDLLGTHTTPTFHTLDPAASGSTFSFAVFGDWGDTTSSNVDDGRLNTNQANLDAQLTASGARFALTAGDTAYPGGSQTNYGDLIQTGADISAVFGPSYWTEPGQLLPVFAVSGNHGQNSTYLLNWPESTSASASNGLYAMTAYPSIDGSTAGSYPTGYYAFSTGGVRFYLLDASWGNSNTGTATGGACGSHCAIYQVDHDAHWTTDSAEYQWLAADLAAHPGGLKFAVFHFPLRSDDATEPDDNYLNVTAGSSSLESLLASGGVQLVFNGHAHDYQRNTAPAGGIISYVTGGGGAKASSIGGKGCSSTDAYAIGWSYTKNKGNACGAATAPTSDAQVYHFLKVTVSGHTVTVTPTDSLGDTFDVQTYTF